MNRRLSLLTIVFSAALLGVGCQNPPDRIDAPQAMETTEQAMEHSSSTEAMASDTAMPEDAAMTESSTYEPFTKEAYERAKSEHKPIFLFFYANWCPYCREQEPRLERVVPSHKGGVVGLRVNFNDSDTDADEKALAKEFGIAYQHTGLFIDKNGAIQKKTVGPITDEQTVEYLDLIK